MAVRMKALRRMYVAADRKEYKIGQEFTVADAREADALSRRNKAAMVSGTNATELPTERDLAGLRAEYKEAYGKRPFHGWSEDALRNKIGEYRTTHMTAQR